MMKSPACYIWSKLSTIKECCSKFITLIALINDLAAVIYDLLTALTMLRYFVVILLIPNFWYRQINTPRWRFLL